MRGRTALLFQTHYMDRALERAFRRLQRQAPARFDCRVLVHLPPGAPVPKRLARLPHYIVRSDALRALPYPRKTAEQDWTGRRWDLWGGGHCDLIPLHAMRCGGDYDFTWVIEYDVAFTGDWSRFFSAFADSEADFLGTCLRTPAEDPHWVCWPSLRGGPDEARLAQAATAALLPVFRVSRRLLRAMDDAYTQGFGGHVEATWPTLARARGFVIEDIGGDGPFVRPGNRNRFYTSSMSSARQFYLAPGTYFAKPAMYRPGRRRDTLWHPVKPWHWRTEIRAGVQEWRTIGGRWKRQLREWLARRGRGTVRG
jgi:hypothetical protein